MGGRGQNKYGTRKILREGGKRVGGGGGAWLSCVMELPCYLK